MRRLSLNRKKRLWLLFLAGGMGLAVLVGILEGGSVKKHNFEGMCQMCHAEIPPTDAAFEEVLLTDQIENVCARCHEVNERTSHPIGVASQTAIPLQRYLDGQGRLTCVTCHDVHKEEDSSLGRQEADGLLRGHVRGRNFCATCHKEELLGANWRHQMVVPYAHMSAELTQEEGGAPLDRFSVECLSCHDGIISKLGQVQVRVGRFRHSIGPSHPVGVEYPRAGLRQDYVDPQALPKGIQLFGGTVGCLSCHNPYGGGKALLVMDNTASALCLSCHRK